MDNNMHDFYATIRAGEDLIHAAGHGRVEGIRRALEKGADVNSLRSDQGALMGATARRSLECVEVLIEHGVDVNQKNRLGWSSLHQASAKDFGEIVSALIKAGANTDAHDAFGITPLIASIRSKSMSSAQILLESGASSTVKDFDGRSPLMWAVSVESEELLSTLAAAGADLSQKDQQGRTAMDLAEESGWDVGLGILRQLERLASKATQHPEVDLDPEVEVKAKTVSKIGKRRVGMG